MQNDKLMTVENNRRELTIEDVKKYICPEATNQEIVLFIELCKAQGLNPFIREAYLIKYGTAKANMVVGKDVFTKRAQNHPKFKGYQAGVIVQRNSDKEIIERIGAFVLNGQETLLGGWAKVFVDGYSEAVENRVSFAEYGSQQSTWKKMPATMIRKVALVQSFREAFPDVLGGLYDSSEMGVEPKENDPIEIKSEHVEAVKKTESKIVKTIEERLETAFTTLNIGDNARSQLMKAYETDFDMLLKLLSKVHLKQMPISDLMDKAKFILSAIEEEEKRVEEAEILFGAENEK